MESQIVDISAITGLTAMIVLTINVLLGMLLSTAYKKNLLWTKLPVAIKKINILQLHNFTAWLALALVLLHPSLLLFDAATKFTVTDIVFPIHAPHQKTFVLLGVLAMYAVLIVVITSQKKIKKKMSFRFWKNIHLISYGTAMLFIIHGLKMDPELKDRQTDWLDGEKLLCELCLLILLAATAMRLRYQFRKNKRPVSIKYQ